MKFAVYIPARNVGRTLAAVVARLPEEVRKNAQEILIVDNASSDNTSDIVRQLSQNTRITCLRNKSDLGYGGSQKTAYQYLLAKNYEAVVMVHGDGQYAPELAGELLQRLEKTKAAMVFGSRMTGTPLKGGMPLYRFFANILLTKIGNIFLGTNFSEFHSGYRAYHLSSLAEARFQSCSDDYHFDTEIIVNLTEKKFTIEEMTIPTHYGKDSGSISFSHSLWYGVNVIRAVVMSRLKAIRKKVT